MNPIPYLPESAPFSPEQRAWLNGFFAGVFSRTNPALTPQQVEAPRLSPLTILYGSQTGTAEALARKAASEAGKRGFAPTVYDMAGYTADRMKNESKLLVLTSTYGDGEPPDSAKGLVEALSNGSSPDLKGVEYSVLALGDTNYEKFCECGKWFDRRLEELGARRVFSRVDCDVDFDAPFKTWLEGVLPALSGSAGTSAPPPPLAAGTPARVAEPPGLHSHSKSNPFSAPLLENRLLNRAGSKKETRHFEISLEGSSLQYEVGDALGVVPRNCGELVEGLLERLGCGGEELVPGADGAPATLRKALTESYDITKPSSKLLEAAAAKSGDGNLRQLLAPESKAELSKYLWGRDVTDILDSVPGWKPDAAGFVGWLKKLQPRLYSISSSPRAHPGQVHLTVAVVRYTSHERGRKGVCSSFLADRVPPGGTLPVFVHSNKAFRPPADGGLPLIMIGPGTGIAPFRAFLEDRGIRGDSGKTWLFFGDQHEATDFLYREELESMQKSGVLTRLDTAFSRDQKEKVYVQDRMREHGAELFEWLEQGAAVYVCGDAARMAKDVDLALHRLIESEGGRSPEQAAAYVKAMKAEKRYQRDVY